MLDYTNSKIQEFPYPAFIKVISAKHYNPDPTKKVCSWNNA